MKEESEDLCFRKWEVLKRWGIDGRRLAEYVCDGLPAYDRNQKRIPTIDDLVITCEYNDEELLEYWADRIAWFIIDDVKDFEAIHSIDVKLNDDGTTQEPPPSHIEQTVETTIPEPNTPRKPVNFFSREGAIWDIGFDGQTKRIQHCDGLLYIVYLLKKPGKSISCIDLYQAGSGKTPDSIMSESAAIDEGLNVGISKQKISDAKTRKICWDEYQKLQEEFPHASMERQEEIQEKIDALIPFLNLKERPFADPNDKKAQVNIGKRLNTAYSAISKVGMEEMAKHLKDHINPDRAFGLSYTGILAWDIVM